MNRTGWDWTIQLVTDQIKLSNGKVLTLKKIHFLAHPTTEGLSTGTVGRLQGMTSGHANSLQPVHRPVLHSTQRAVRHTLLSLSTTHCSSRAARVLATSSHSLVHHNTHLCGRLTAMTVHCSHSHQRVTTADQLLHRGEQVWGE